MISYILNKIIKSYEEKLSGYSYNNYKYVDFIVWRFHELSKRHTIKGLVELIYTKCHKYNPHPFLYNGKFSETKMVVHLLNQDVEYLKWLTKELIDYEGKNGN